MKKKTKRILIFLGLACITTLLFIAWSNLQSKPDNVYTFKIIQTEDFWCYEILRNNKVIIRQEFIPAIQGNKRFTDQETVRRTALMVLHKLQKKQIPSVTPDEMCSINSAYCD